MQIGPAAKPGAATPARGARRARGADTGFTVPDQADDGVAAAEALPPAVTVGALAPAGPPAGANLALPPEAHRKAAAMLHALAGLQLAALGGDAAAGHDALDRLGDLPATGEPGLDGVLQAVAQRAAVERAKRS